jgi:hypothetical protein
VRTCVLTELEDLEDAYTGLVRAVGFRCVGLSPYLALSTDPEHPCNRLLASNDHNDPECILHANDLEELEAIIDEKRVKFKIFGAIGHRLDDFRGYPDSIVKELAELK